MDLVVVFRTFDLAEAQLLCSRLQAAGIEAAVEHEHSAANLDVPVGGSRVVVSSDKAEDARALIQSASSE
jgi:hypothetical protein